MTKEQELQQDTEKLRQLISQVDNSGVSAWEAGDLLKVVKDKKGYLSQYGKFENYTKIKVGINPKTANNYIAIRENFTKEQIGNIMLVTHLRVIAEIGNDKIRNIVLKNFKEVEESSNKNENDEPYKIKLSDIIGTVTMVLGSEVELSEDEIKDIIEINIQKGKEEKKKRKKNREKQKQAVFGDPFKSDFFKDITALIENEPINEMGVVALFCVMFSSLRGTQFDFLGELITFVSIKYIRVEFPDASIRCKYVGKKKNNFELGIEFEFESYNYVRHNHMQSKEKCDLIVCWTDNAKSDEKLKNNPTVKKMPPILSLKKCFETGEIELL